MDNCSICFTQLNKKNNALTECNHLYHYRCLSSYLYSRRNLTNDHMYPCPLCRTEISFNYIKLNNISENNIRYAFTNITHIELSQCNGTTKPYGKRCKNQEFPMNSGFCRIHFKRKYPINVEIFEIIFKIFIFHYPFDKYKNLMFRNELFNTLIGVCLKNKCETYEDIKIVLVEVYGKNKPKTFVELKKSLLE